MAALAARLTAAAEAVGAAAPGRLDAARGAKSGGLWWRASRGTGPCRGRVRIEERGAVGVEVDGVAAALAAVRPCGRAAGVLSRTGPRLRAARPTMSDYSSWIMAVYHHFISADRRSSHITTEVVPISLSFIVVKHSSCIMVVYHLYAFLTPLNFLERAR